MTLAKRLLMAAGVTPPTGQQIFGFPSGITSFLVPPGVTSVCIACVGAGVDGIVAPSGTSGGGGACAWSNNIPVTPGETLQVQVGARRARADTRGPGETWVRRSGVNLVMAVPGINSNGGVASDCVGDNRFSGRNGGTAIGGSAAGLRGTLPAALFQRGGTGVEFGAASWQENPNTIGNAIFRHGGQAAGGGGAGGVSGSIAPAGAVGGAIIIWGPGRGFSLASNDY